MKSFKVVGLSDSEKWEKYMKKMPLQQRDVYYTPQYYKLYELIGDGLAQCVIFEFDNEIVLYPFLKNEINSLGYKLNEKYYDIQGAYGYNGVISSTNDSQFINQFYQTFEEYCHDNNIIAEFIRFHPLLENYAFSKKHLKVILDRETVTLDLTQGYEDVWVNEFSSKTRNMIRKARKLGYASEILSNPSLAEINQFISIYISNMKMVDAEKYYYFNNEFFHNTFAYLMKYVYLFNIHNAEGQVVCSSIFFHYGDYFHYHLSGRSEKADNSVNNFLLDEAVKFAQKIGARTFHFGGGRSKAPNDKLLKFKSNFSKMQTSFYIGKKIHNQEVYDKVIKQWGKFFPEKIEIFNNTLLKYRY